jgi:hypothetical protein
VRRVGVIALLVVSVQALGGCGGSGSSAERKGLEAKLSAQTGDLPSDLAGCVRQQAARLPTSQLRALADAGANPGPATKQTAVRLIVGCIGKGNGAAGLRTLIVQRIASTFPSTLPADFTSCVEDKASAIPASQLSAFLSTYATQGQAATTAQAEAYGHQLGIECLGQPGVIRSLRVVFLKPLQRFAQTSRFSKAFRECVLGKAEQISDQQVEQFALHPQQASTLGNALGRGYARACIAQGARP